MFYGSQKIRSRYLGDKLVWGDNLDVQSISFNNIFLYFQPYPYTFYNCTAAQLHFVASDAQLIRGKNIVSIELDGKKSDVKWTFPTSGSSLDKNYLAVETTTSTFDEIQNKAKADYGVSSSKSIKNVVVYYTV